ncbi:MAG: acylphosphatase [Caldimicrobium sp.]|uniref:Acylphosphatase n=1 Tax=Caldimicrobium thiodismutans TaxID=1653476 RepID=A0A2N7PHY1_9BACT|nr:MAG: acylphosphatase [Caldimicrobium thiodismutans]
MKRVRVLISGKVQGVFFRAYTKEEADKLGVKGWVRNLPDGRVEALFEGEDEAVNEMIKWCHKGSPSSKVTKVEVFEEPYVGEFKDFKIRY